MELQIKSFSLSQSENTPQENRFYSVAPERRNPNNEDSLNVNTKNFFISLPLTEKDDLISISFTKKDPGQVIGRLTFISDEEEYCEVFVNFNVFPFFFEHKIKKKCFIKVKCYFNSSNWICFDEINNFVVFSTPVENQENLNFLNSAYNYPEKIFYVENP